MNLPLPSPLLPMLAKRIDAVPLGGGFQFEPKWDGFRTVVFRDGDDLLIQSRDGKPLDRYFPELRTPLLAQLPQRCVLDGEIVIARPDAHRGTSLDFDALQLRVHPAASRVKLLSQQTPASVVFFDVIALGDVDLTNLPFMDRRKQLEDILRHAQPPLHLTPATADRAVAQDWFRRFEGAGLDGLIAKPLTGIYTPDKRTQFKIKHERDCDCVVAGFRWHKNGEGSHVGSLLLGLFDASGSLQNVGVCASFTAARRQELVPFLAPYRENALHAHPWANWSGAEAGPALPSDATPTDAIPKNATPTDAGTDNPFPHPSTSDEPSPQNQRMPGGKSRWNNKKDLSWQPLRPELVVEVAYEHMQGNRFRHLAHFRRWRTGKPVEACTYEQLEVVPPQELMDLFPSPR